MTNPDLIVSRHPATIGYLSERYPGVPVLAEVTADDVRGRVVVGNVPLHLAALCVSVIAVEFAGPAPRGAEYDAAAMEAAGVRLVEYVVVPAVGDVRAFRDCCGLPRLAQPT
jgi:hypothetical protein